MKRIKKCIVHRCTNTSDQGGFVGNLCVPCHEFITTGRGVHSTIYRNAKIKGAIECLKELLDHARAHLYDIKHKHIVKYLKATEKVYSEYDK